MSSAPVTSSDHVRGNPNAPTTLVEYGDYQCPFCAAAQVVVERVRNHFGSHLRFVYRHFPLTQVHPEAANAAQTVEFAGDHEMFWPMHDSIFAQKAPLSLPIMLAMVEARGMFPAKLRAALAAGTYLHKIHDDFMGGVRSGVNGTPTFFVDGERHNGPLDLDSLVSSIEAHVRHLEV